MLYFYDRPGAKMAKRHNRPTLRIVIKYFLLQLPGQVSFALILLLFRRWVEVPGYLTWGVLGLWVAKDVCLFPFLWRFYDPSHYPDRFRMAGRKGYALTRLNPGGYVQVRGERWQARVADGQAPIEQGRAIYVQAIHGLTLTVAPCADDQAG
jgi:membrane protein implicated in regulation of membrane protease activity